MSNARVLLNQTDTELEVIIKIPLQPFINLIAEKIKPTNQEMKADTILSAKEASDLLRISSRTLFRWKKAGKVKYIIRGSRYFFKKSSLDELNVEKRLTGIKY